MEPYTHYLMWIKSKHILNSINNSWEEQAFAEDAAGPFGGFVWPPRSYSCSFCKREFRSAQALGGHMNVHRRDRARLKQSLCPPTEVLHDQPHNQSMGAQNLSQIRNILGPRYVSSPSAVSPNSRVSAIYSQENSIEHACLSPFVTPLKDKECQKQLLFSLVPPCLNSSGTRFLDISCSNTTYEKNTVKEESMMLNHEANMKTKLSIGIDLVNFQNPPVESDFDETIKCKRHKTTAVSSLAFLHKTCSTDGYALQDEALRIKVSSMEDIDLELRLGDPPAVK